MAPPLQVRRTEPGRHGAGLRLCHTRPLPADELLYVLGDRPAYEATFVAALDAGGYDAVLCPAIPFPAPTHGATRHLPDAAA